MRLEVFANLFTCLILRSTVSEISFVEQKRECVVVNVAQRAVRNGHRRYGQRWVVPLWRDGDHNLADVGIGFHMLMRLDDLCEVKATVNHRPQYSRVKIR